MKFSYINSTNRYHHLLNTRKRIFMQYFYYYVCIIVYWIDGLYEMLHVL